jgi:hypothetical protein
MVDDLFQYDDNLINSFVVSALEMDRDWNRRARSENAVWNRDDCMQRMSWQRKTGFVVDFTFSDAWNRQVLNSWEIIFARNFEVDFEGFVERPWDVETSFDIISNGTVLWIECLRHASRKLNLEVEFVNTRRHLNRFTTKQKSLVLDIHFVSWVIFSSFSIPSRPKWTCSSDELQVQACNRISITNQKENLLMSYHWFSLDFSNSIREFLNNKFRILIMFKVAKRN